MGRGRKQCKNCGLVVGVRTFNCPDCGQRFETKINPKKAVLDWKTLKPETRIKSLQGRGPYYVDKVKGRIPMGYYGDFIVREVKENGIVCVATSGDDRGQYVFIYMGEVKYSDNVCLYMEPHCLEYSNRVDHPGWKKVNKQKSKLKRK